MQLQCNTQCIKNTFIKRNFVIFNVFAILFCTVEGWRRMTIILTVQFWVRLKISRIAYSTHCPSDACADKCPLCYHDAVIVSVWVALSPQFIQELEHCSPLTLPPQHCVSHTGFLIVSKYFPYHWCIKYILFYQLTKNSVDWFFFNWKNMNSKNTKKIIYRFCSTFYTKCRSLNFFTTYFSLNLSCHFETYCCHCNVATIKFSSQFLTINNWNFSSFIRC